MPTDLELLARLALAAVLGGAVGVERELSDQPAGLRTHMLLTIGACLFTLVSAYGFDRPGDPARIAAQIVTGIGFLGGGAILRHGASIRGLTTAASIWATAALGVTVGAGRYLAAPLRARAVPRGAPRARGRPRGGVGALAQGAAAPMST